MLPTASTTARGRLRLSLRLMPTLATMAMLVLDTTAMLDIPMLPMDTTTARGRLRPSPRLMPMLTTTVLAMLVLATDTPMAMDTPMPTLSTMERGRLRPSLRLMPTLATMAMLVLDTTAMLDTPMLPMDTT